MTAQAEPSSSGLLRAKKFLRMLSDFYRLSSPGRPVYDFKYRTIQRTTSFTEVVGTLESGNPKNLEYLDHLSPKKDIDLMAWWKSEGLGGRTFCGNGPDHAIADRAMTRSNSVGTHPKHLKTPPKRWTSLSPEYQEALTKYNHIDAFKWDRMTGMRQTMELMGVECPVAHNRAKKEEGSHHHHHHH